MADQVDDCVLHRLFGISWVGGSRAIRDNLFISQFINNWSTATAPMLRKTNYCGLDDDAFGGMTQTGHIVRDAQVFGLIPEDQTCAGWSLGTIQDLYDKVSDAWAPYGHLASRLPDDLRERHRRIYDAAIARARQLGWKPELYDD
jgi:hypothetical protein